jgi:hypothetical protein
VGHSHMLSFKLGAVPAFGGAGCGVRSRSMSAKPPSTASIERPVLVTLASVLGCPLSTHCGKFKCRTRIKWPGAGARRRA